MSNVDPKPWLHSLDAAASLMPERWWLHAAFEVRAPTIYKDDAHRPTGYFRCELQSEDGGRLQSAKAPTEPQARVAAGLLAMAADMEASDAEERD